MRTECTKHRNLVDFRKAPGRLERAKVSWDHTLKDRIPFYVVLLSTSLYPQSTK